MESKNAKVKTEEGILDRVVYSESAKINTGDFESRDVFYSYSTDVQPDETVDEAYKRCRSTVRQHLANSEKRIRIKSKKDVDFDTMKKLDYWK